MAVPTSQTTGRIGIGIAAVRCSFGGPDQKARSGRLCARSYDECGGGGGHGARNSRRAAMAAAINGGARVNGTAAGVSDAPPPSSTVDGGDAFRLGKFVEGKLVYRQRFVVRSYEIGPDRTATMETLMNLLQETALNHVMSSGLAGDGFGATRQMSLRKLIWVVTRINIQVDKYSRWGDVVEIDTWVASSGKNGMRRDWIIRDRSSKATIAKATSNWVMMNRETRRLSKIPDEVREEVLPFYLDRSIVAAGADRNCKIQKLTENTAKSIRSGLAPRWSDMDVNQHVNNVKYIGWILESVPLDVLERYHLTSITLDYRRECRQSQILESLTTMSSTAVAEAASASLQSTHLIRQQDDMAEIVRARAEWRCKEQFATMRD